MDHKAEVNRWAEGVIERMAARWPNWREAQVEIITLLDTEPKNSRENTEAALMRICEFVMTTGARLR